MLQDRFKPSRSVILVGGGGHCKSVIDAAESAGIRIHGVLDMPELLGSDVLGYKVIGNDDDIPLYVGEFDFVITLGFIRNADSRIRLHRLVRDAGGSFATIVASTARVSPHAKLGEGTVVLHHASVNAGAKIGCGCIINTAANIEHDAIVGDYCHVSTGSMVNGDCHIGAGCFLGSGTVINNGVSICDNCIISSGSLVRHRLRIPGVYNGSPAVRYKI